MTTKTVSPYINTILSTTLLLYPHQMDNNIYINLKTNAEKKHLHKCYSNFGYIDKIIEITEYKDGVIEAENTQSSARFDIKMLCKLCYPLKNTQIIAQVDMINITLMTARNGPIIIAITSERFNEDIFFKDINGVLRYKKGNKSIAVQPKDFIKVTIQSKKFNDGDERISTIGFIDDLATEEEIQKFYEAEYKDIVEVVDYEKYITIEQ